MELPSLRVYEVLFILLLSPSETYTVPEPVALGYASWDPRGYYHYHERPGGAFISKDRYLDLIKPSTAGYHGYGGRLQPYGAIAQILGEGIPTTGHRWWRSVTEMDVPMANIARRGATQYMMTLTSMNSEGRIITDRLFSPIGGGYDLQREEQAIQDMLTSGSGSPPRKAEEEEDLWEIHRTVTQLFWNATNGY